VSKCKPWQRTDIFRICSDQVRMFDPLFGENTKNRFRGKRQKFGENAKNRKRQKNCENAKKLDTYRYLEPSLKSHRWLVNVYDLELVVHSVELDGVRVLLLRMAPNDGVRILLLRITACTSSFCVLRACSFCTSRPLVNAHTVSRTPPRRGGQIAVR
jgi:hypothetical protein